MGGLTAGITIGFMGSPVGRALGITTPYTDLALIGLGLFGFGFATGVISRWWGGRRIERTVRAALPKTPEELAAARARAGWAEGEQPLATLHLVTRRLSPLRSRNGSLVLTDRALRFVAKKDAEVWPLDRITATEPVPHAWVLPYGLAIRTTDGASARFVVSPFERDRWLAAIDAARAAVLSVR